MVVSRIEARLPTSLPFCMDWRWCAISRLTEKQRRFADEYIISANATQAAIKAGYSPKTAGVIGDENLKKPYIKTYIDEQLEKLQSKRVADQQEVLEFLTSVMRGEVTEPLLILDGEGTQKLAMVKPSVATRRSAAVDLGKRYGLFVDRQEITQRTIEIKVGEWDADEDET